MSRLAWIILCLPVSCTVLSKDEYAVTRIYGQTLICASVTFTPCGARLFDCASGMRYECVTDVEIVNLTELKRRANQYIQENAR